MDARLSREAYAYAHMVPFFIFKYYVLVILVVFTTGQDVFSRGL